MAERIVSPGVFTREKDLSFLPQSIGAIGAAIILSIMTVDLNYVIQTVGFPVAKLNYDG